jgi:DNA-binding MarR family transcriptional regulator
MSIENDIKQKQFKSPYQRLSINLIYTSNWLSYGRLELFREHDITSQQYNVLRILRGQYPNPVRVSDIGDRMLDKTSNASRLVDKLLGKDLLTRYACPTDRRAMNVLITEKGLELLNILDPLVEEEEKELCKLSVEEAELLSNLLDKLRGSE